MTIGKSIFVTQPALPPLAEFLPLLEEIWERRHLTNNGPVLQRLEVALQTHLGVEHISLVANATLGLMLALQGLGPEDEVITSPFSFVASAHAIKWAGARPAFVDIEPTTLNIDPAAVRRQINSRTRAILAVHSFGLPCNVLSLKGLARDHGLRLIFDAAHAFNVNLNGQSLLSHGDFSVVSFHATKIFSTVEGGAIISRDRQTKIALDRLANFGILNETCVAAVGLNAKMSELHAAFGLTLLRQVPAIIDARRAVARRYLSGLADLTSLRCVCHETEGHNYYAFPIILDSPPFREELYKRLSDSGIFARRYFHPIISDMPTFRKRTLNDVPVARDIASRILCLPIFPNLSFEDQDRIISIVREVAERHRMTSGFLPTG